MIRINLLPKDILEKRRYERFFVWVYLAAGVIAIALLGIWLLLGMQVSERHRDLQSRQELADKLRAEADAFAVFEHKQADLNARKAVAATALAGRINWARVCTEVSMVLPPDAWAKGFTANQDTGVQFTFVALDTVDSPDAGHKAVAQSMVRLNGLASLFDVWLSATSKGELQIGDSQTPVIDYQLTAKVVKPAPANATAGSSVPAPPAPGQ